MLQVLNNVPHAPPFNTVTNALKERTQYCICYVRTAALATVLPLSVFLTKSLSHSLLEFICDVFVSFFGGSLPPINV